MGTNLLQPRCMSLDQCLTFVLQQQIVFACMQNLTLFGSGGNDTARRGIVARQRGLRPKHPVVIIPGADSSRPDARHVVPCGICAVCAVVLAPWRASRHYLW